MQRQAHQPVKSSASLSLLSSETALKSQILDLVEKLLFPIFINQLNLLSIVLEICKYKIKSFINIGICLVWWFVFGLWGRLLFVCFLSSWFCFSVCWFKTVSLSLASLKLLTILPLTLYPIYTVLGIMIKSDTSCMLCKHSTN